MCRERSLRRKAMENSTVKTMQNGTTPFGLDMFCDRYWSSENYKIYNVFSVFGGLVDCFVYDVVLFLVCVLVFSILRKRAGNYGTMGLDERLADGKLNREMHAYNVWATMLVSDDQGGPDDARNSFDIRLLLGDQGLFAWIPAVFRIQDIDIYRRCGPDAMQYLTFQKYLIAYQIVVTVICMAVVLPVNITQGNNADANDAFGQTTILNIDPNSPVLWLHCTLGLVLLFMAIVFMRHFIENVHDYNLFEEVSKTVMIYGIPVDKCFSHFIEKHFEEAYPECEVTDVQFAYNIKHLISLEFKRLRARTALISSQLTAQETGERQKIMPYCCGAFLLQFSRCCEFCGLQQVDAIDYYSDQLSMYQELCDAEKVNSYHDPIGIVFVTFAHVLMTERVLSDFRKTWKCGRKVRTSSVSRGLHVRDWRVTSAPSPVDIFWQNLTINLTMWWAKAAAVNFGILLIAIFCSTPSVVLNQLSRIEAFQSEAQSNIVLNFIPTLLLIIASTILPTIVSCSDFKLVGHFTRSSLNHTVMVKVFVFLLVMVLFLPSAGFSSIGSVVEWMSSGQRNFKFRWDCMLISKNCAFFVDYMIGAATLGIGMELLRLSDLILYCVMWSLSTSHAERPMLRKYIISEFRYGIYYAWILCNFTVNMAYSIVSPMITVPGLVYLVLKHYSDRHSLCFVYKASKINTRIHEAAINFVMISVFCLQLTVLSFILLRADKGRSISMFAMVTLVSIVILFFLTMCRGKITPPEPPEVHQEVDFEALVEDQESERLSFMPAVLEDNYEEEGYLPTNLAYSSTETMHAKQAQDVQRKSRSRFSEESRMEKKLKHSNRKSRISGKYGQRDRRSEGTSSETDEYEIR